MPILYPGDPEFRGFDITSPFDSQLHSEQIIAGGAVSEFYRNLVAETSVANQWANFSSITRYSLGNIGMTTGWPLDRLGALTVLFSEAPKITAAQIGKVIKSLELIGALLEFDEALDLVATKAPIVGWVVQLGLFIYEVIRNVIAVTKQEKDTTAQAQAIAYSRGADEDMVRGILDRLKDESWTLLFLPQGYPEDVCTKTLAYTQRGRRDGVSWEVCKPGAGNWGWGLTPGLSSRFTGCVGVFQSPRRLAGSTRDAGIESITGFGEMVPSVTQAGLGLWQMMLKNSPNAFRIKGAKIVRAWQDYYNVMYDWAINGTDDEWLRKQILYGSQWYFPDFDSSVVVATSGGSFGSRGRDKSGSLVAGYEPGDMPAKYTQSKLWSYAELIAYVVEQVWQPRLSGFLETLTCAYVAPNAQALIEDPALREKHDDMRRLLLTHNSRHEVELDMIPDAEYRSAMKIAQQQVDPWYTLDQGNRKPPRQRWLDFVPPIDPNRPPPGEPEGDPAPGLPPVQGGGGGGGAALILGALGLTAAVLVARRAS